ncbi:MAG: nucleotidyltransferase domain-containing protein [Nanoarchaeota archaeon]|nr:nucleotidyltransferase domain-containing protein [Nanoarchaeota archaeon]
MKAEYKIFKAFLEKKQEKIYFNELKEYTKLSNSSLQNTLKGLIKNNMLKVEKTKSNTFYSIKNKKSFALKFSELALKRFNNLNIGIKNPLRNFMENLPNTIFSIILFGSASERREQKHSDIDLLIVSNSKNDFAIQKKKAEVTSKYPISIFQCSIKQFFDNKDDIIIQARKTGFPIYKEQNFYEAIMDEY